MAPTTFVVKHGSGTIEIPGIGFGAGTAWNRVGLTEPELPINQDLIAAIETALKTGFRLIDSAEAYRNDGEVGLAIKASKIPRNELFVTTKVSKTFESVEETIKKQLSELQLEYVDLYLIHSPHFSKQEGRPSLKEVWEKMESIKEAGLAKAIGVSNFQPEDLKEILDDCRIKPALHQIEFHPYVYSGLSKLIKFCNDNEILLQAYGASVPTAKKTDGPLTPVLERLSTSLSSKLSKPINPTQVVLRWCLQKGVAFVTTSSKEFRMKETLEVDEFELDDEQMKEIDSTVQGYFYRHLSWGASKNDPPQSK
ncbi:Aldo/keto reductase [Atractiella rhizophila]|nr:Aldo/keto reductase [Atractiella rhizophila]